MGKRTYWLPRGARVKWNDIEIVLDDESNSVLVEESDWPTVQHHFFEGNDFDDDLVCPNPSCPCNRK